MISHPYIYAGDHMSDVEIFIANRGSSQTKHFAHSQLGILTIKHSGWSLLSDQDRHAMSVHFFRIASVLPINFAIRFISIRDKQNFPNNIIVNKYIN